MGQTLSAPSSSLRDGNNIIWPAPVQLSDNIPLPSNLPPHNTTITKFYNAPTNDADAFQEGKSPLCHNYAFIHDGHVRFSIPVGFAARCRGYNGQPAHISVEKHDQNVIFVVRTENGEVFSGSTPTSPFAKWAFSLGRFDVINGFEAFAFMHPQVCAILRGLDGTTVDRPVTQIDPGVAVGQWFAQTKDVKEQQPLVQEISEQATATTPSFILAPALPSTGGGHGLPPRSPLPSPALFDNRSPEMHAAVLLQNRPASRSRSRRSGSVDGRSSGRGWTAFTAFGLEIRDAVREEHPKAAAGEIEKIVGRRWAALSPDDKQHYTEVAVEVRRKNVNAPGVVVVGGGEEHEHEEGEGEVVGGGGGGGDGFGVSAAATQLKRTRSDAATSQGDRQLRTTRKKARTYGPEYEMGDVLLLQLPISEMGQRQGAALEMSDADGQVKNMQKKGGKRRAVEAAEKEEKAEDEADVLSVLADMRAEVLASESAEAMRSEYAGVPPHDDDDEVLKRNGGDEAHSRRESSEKIWPVNSKQR